MAHVAKNDDTSNKETEPQNNAYNVTSGTGLIVQNRKMRVLRYIPWEVAGVVGSYPRCTFASFG